MSTIVHAKPYMSVFWLYMYLAIFELRFSFFPTSSLLPFLFPYLTKLIHNKRTQVLLSTIVCMLHCVLLLLRNTCISPNRRGVHRKKQIIQELLQDNGHAGIHVSGSGNGSVYGRINSVTIQYQCVHASGAFYLIHAWCTAFTTLTVLWKGQPSPCNTVRKSQ